VRTPCYAVDLGIAKANADAMLATASALGVTIRPHVKTHKTVEVALLQTGGRRGGICVSTLAEADFFASRRFGDILYACPLTPDKVPACAALAARIPGGGLIVCVDSDAQLDAILAHPLLGWPTEKDASSADDEYSPAFVNPFSVRSSSDGSSEALLPSAAAVATGQPWRIALLVDCGYRREGLDPFVAQERLQLAHLAARVATSPWAKLHGVYAHGEMKRERRDRYGTANNNNTHIVRHTLLLSLLVRTPLSPDLSLI
jgi:D-serine deaminase-like pyridoxal phosphate-dependent protein